MTILKRYFHEFVNFHFLHSSLFDNYNFLIIPGNFYSRLIQIIEVFFQSTIVDDPISHLLFQQYANLHTIYDEGISKFKS